MEVHVLNGDALAYKFPVEGQVVVAREAMVDGPVQADSIEAFWKLRADYLTETYLEDESPQYYKDVKEEFEKLLSLESATGINLWFEHDLFCQVNMWFVINYLVQNKIDFPFYRVMPSPDIADIWSGFGRLTNADLRRCYELRRKFGKEDIELGTALWKAYSTSDLVTLQKLSLRTSACFPLLEEACNAHLQRFPLKDGRPQRRLKQIIKSG